MAEPVWSWDQEVDGAGYIDIVPECMHRWNREPIEAEGVTFIVDEDENGNIVGIEVLL